MCFCKRLPYRAFKDSYWTLKSLNSFVCLSNLLLQEAYELISELKSKKTSVHQIHQSIEDFEPINGNNTHSVNMIFCFNTKKSDCSFVSSNTNDATLLPKSVFGCRKLPLISVMIWFGRRWISILLSEKSMRRERSTCKYMKRRGFNSWSSRKPARITKFDDWRLCTNRS